MLQFIVLLFEKFNVFEAECVGFLHRGIKQEARSAQGAAPGLLLVLGTWKVAWTLVRRKKGPLGPKLSI